MLINVHQIKQKKDLKKLRNLSIFRYPNWKSDDTYKKKKKTLDNVSNS